MPRFSAVCPLAYEVCKSCKALFVDNNPKGEHRLRGCQLIEAARKQTPLQ